MTKIWIDKSEYYIYSYMKTSWHGTEVEISEEELKILEEVSNKFTEAQEILAKLLGTTLVEEGWGKPTSVWP